MDNIVLENFINFCDDIMIANEGLSLVDNTPNWMLESNKKYNKNRHTYKVNGKSIYNSRITIDSYQELDNGPELDKKISKILRLVNKAKPEIDKLISTSLFQDAEEWEVPVKNLSELNRLIMSLDNCIDIHLNESNYHVALYVNNSSSSAHANDFFGNHCWVVYLNADNYDATKLIVEENGLNG